MVRIAALSKRISLSVRILPLILVLLLVGGILLIRNLETRESAGTHRATVSGPAPIYRPGISRRFTVEDLKSQPSLTVDEIQDPAKVTFAVKLSGGDSESLIGTLEGIYCGERESGGGKITKVSLLFSKGFLVTEFKPSESGEAKFVSNYVENESALLKEDIRKGIYKRITVNGVQALVHRPYVEEDVPGPSYNVSARIDWVKDGVWYTVKAPEGNSEISAETVTEVAKLFN